MFEDMKKMFEKELKQQPELAKQIKSLMVLYDLGHNRGAFANTCAAYD